MSVQNEKDFLQAKLESETNARFLLNEHGEPHFLMHEIKLHKVIHYISRFEERTRAQVALGMCARRELLSL